MEYDVFLYSHSVASSEKKYVGWDEKCLCYKN